MAGVEDIGSRFKKKVCRNSVLSGKGYIKGLKDERTNEWRFFKVFRIL